jgi:tetratricopeptide (TPR) repeat protein
MSDASSLRDRYVNLIDHIVQLTLKGKIRSKEQVYQLLNDGIETGTGELFERCLGDRLSGTQRQLETQIDELQHAKALRSQRALKTIQGEWERWQQRNQADQTLTAALQSIVQSESDRLSALLLALDPNQPHPLHLGQWKTLAQQLAATPDPRPQSEESFIALAHGIQHGIESWQCIEPHLVSWIYDQGRSLGFEGAGQRGPWMLWSQQVRRPIPKALFETLALGRSLPQWAERPDTVHGQALTLHATDWIELAILLRCLQQGLVAWFDKLVYDSSVGAKLSRSTYLVFAIIWAQLGQGLRAQTQHPTLSQTFANVCLQAALQVLRAFAQRDYFPLYGGIFVSFSGQYLADTLSYLDLPLQRAEGTQEKARILTLLGYSARVLGQRGRALTFYTQALEIAQAAGDRPCQIAVLNHLSRMEVGEQHYRQALGQAQRALILSREVGDRPGEANALANLGFSEIFEAQQREEADPNYYEAAIDRLQQGLQLAERLGDRQSQALCLSSLGIAHVVIESPQQAIAFLDGGIHAAQFTGDLFLHGTNLAYLAEAYYQLHNLEAAVYAAALGMYLLHQMASSSWRQPAGLLQIIQGQLGEEPVKAVLAQHRTKLIAVIGVDGYDYLPILMAQNPPEA